METIEIQIKSNIPQASSETQGYRKQIRDLRKEIDNLTPGTEAYNDTLSKLANTMHNYQEEQLLVRNSAGDLGTAFSNLQKLGTGVAAGFSSVNAIMALTGTNSEALQQTMVKLQAGIALVQGMKGLEGMSKTMKATINSLKSMFTSTKVQTTATAGLSAANVTATVTTKGLSTALKGLKAALISTGIGAIVVLVGELINGLSKLFSWVQKNVSAQNEFKDANDKLNKSFEKQNEILNNEIKLLSASGASQEEIISEKQRLIAVQKAETEATLKNAKARLQSLKADSAWTRFWHGENKVIKELESETIPELEATLEGLEKQATSLSYDYKAAEIKTQKDLENKRKQAAQKAVETAKREAEQRKKFLDDVEKKAEDSFERIFEAYKGKLLDIKHAKEAILDNATINQAISDITAFGLVYGTDFNKMDKQLQGVQSALIRNAIDAAAKERDKLLAEKAGDTEAQDKIVAQYEKFVSDIHNLVNNLPADLAPAMVEAIDEAANAAVKISEEFTERFNSLNSLYKDGIITYEEYFDTLTEVQNDYLDEVDNFEEQYVSKVEGNEARVTELRYQYAIKPLEFQKEVGEKFLNELDRNLAAIENRYSKAETLIEASEIYWQGTLNTISGQWANSLKQRYDNELAILAAKQENQNQYYSQEKARIEQELENNMLTVEQRSELWAQIEALDAEHLIKVEEFNAQYKELNSQWKQDLTDTIISGVNEFATLTSALNSVSKAQLEEYKRQYEAGEISQEKYEKLQKEALEQQAALQIATTIMQTGAGIATVWAQAAQLGPIAGPIIAGIQTAAYLANMVAQIMSIKTALKSGLAGSTSGGSETSAPDTSFTLTSTDAYQNTLSDETQTDLQANAKSNQRVYVVSGDITNAQNNERTTVSTSTF